MANIKKHFESLKNVGFYETSTSKILRDKIAKSIRKHSVDLHNNLSEKEICVKLLETSIEIVASQNLKEQYDEDLDTISENVKYGTIFADIVELRETINDMSSSTLEAKLQKIKTDLVAQNIYSEMRDNVATVLIGIVESLIDMDKWAEKGIPPSQVAAEKSLLCLKYALDMTTKQEVKNT